MDVLKRYRAAVESGIDVDQREDIARKVARANFAGLSRDEQQILGEIIHTVVSDVEERVRVALSEELATNPSAPADIIHQLARDSNLVASPVLRVSELFTPEDLVALIRSEISHEKMKAIAQRPRVPASICQALAEVGGVGVAEELLRNFGADLPEPALSLILDLYGDSHSIQERTIERPTLPPKIIGKLVSFVAGNLLSRLVGRHKLPEAAARRLVLSVQNQALLGYTTQLDSDGLTSLADRLISDGALTPSLVLRSIAVGNMEFLTHVIALRSHVSPQYVRDRLKGDEDGAVEALWTGASLPVEYLAFAQMSRSVLRDVRENRSAAFCRFQIVEKFLATLPEVADRLSPEDRAFLEAARDQSLADLSDLL